ncbi:hypothetical protein [Brevibacillus choshinensis]|uniref:hypothetical protein n=1 Tax=Brevibacillus choshinensis TaxID=54911 RepID=UPI002E1A6ED3|nr:hypothetical protein [Brevibacillus choshinensis]
MNNLLMRGTEPNWSEMTSEGDVSWESMRFEDGPGYELVLDGGPGWDIAPAPTNGPGETGKALLH